MVVDDTVMYRKILADALRAIPGVEVVATACDGNIALAKIDIYKPDLLTLDLEMPKLDGLGVLRELRKQSNPPGVIMLSASTFAGAKDTTAALRLGAFDFVLKPTSSSITENMADIRKRMAEKIDAFRNTRRVDQAEPRTFVKDRPASAHPNDRSIEPKAEPPRAHSPQRPEVVAIGISTGGPQALACMLPKLPADLPIPILIVQHMPPLFTESLAADLNRRCMLNVCEAKAGQRVEAGRVYIAPGGRQMKVQHSVDGVVIAITDDPRENSCRPAVDYLFRSVAKVYGGAAMGVIMTGMGSDGTVGSQLLKRRGASIIAQDEESCVVFGMPRLLVEEGIADIVSPLDNISDHVVRYAEKGVLA